MKIAVVTGASSGMGKQFALQDVWFAEAFQKGEIGS